MNLNEFKAWFEGFSEGIDKTPSAKQWAKINEKIAAITPEPTKIEYIRDYYDRYRPWWSAYPQVWLSNAGVGVGAAGGIQFSNNSAAAAPNFDAFKAETVEFTAQAFKAMGRADFDGVGGH